MAADSKSGITGKSAFDLFPDIMKKNAPPRQEVAKVKPQPGKGGGVTPASSGKLPEPPLPPDISWLRKGEDDAPRRMEDVPAAMIFMAEGEAKTIVAEVLEDFGYQVEAVDSETAALEKMKFVNFAAVVMQTGGDGVALEKSEFHRHLKWLPMTARRSIYYVLIGPRFQTGYDLQALAASANLVVNDRDVGKMAVVLGKGLRDYEQLFGPYLAFLQEHGKR
ncbi:MAG: hypothetical protein HY885_01960 [Deltaproteobacteria bacterium]|nr:hypothetical protein [Deltaproteobacteria bacterium]